MEGNDIKSKKKSLTRADLVDAICDQVGFSYSESSRLLEGFLTLVTDTLMQGGKIKLFKLGSFYVYTKKQRIGRNPRTGEEVVISPRKVISFRPSQLLKSKANAAAQKSLSD